MANWFSQVITGIKSIFNGLQARQFLAVVLVGFFLLTTNVRPEQSTFGRDNSKVTTDKVLERVHENNSPRPKTTGEWQKDDRETANNLDERGRRINQQAGAAFKEFGSGYVEAVKDATQDAKNSAARAGSKVIDQVR